MGVSVFDDVAPGFRQACRMAVSLELHRQIWKLIIITPACISPVAGAAL